jgi:hypothetical protein
VGAEVGRRVGGPIEPPGWDSYAGRRSRPAPGPVGGRSNVRSTGEEIPNHERPFDVKGKSEQVFATNA